MIKKAQSFAEALLDEANIAQSGNGICVIGRLAENLGKACLRRLHIFASKGLEAALIIGRSNILLLFGVKGCRDRQ